jgi:hypothetical protein
MWVVDRHGTEFMIGRWYLGLGSWFGVWISLWQHACFWDWALYRWSDWLSCYVYPDELRRMRKRISKNCNMQGDDAVRDFQDPCDLEALLKRMLIGPSAGNKESLKDKDK